LTSTPMLRSTFIPPPYVTPTVPEIFIIGVEIIIFIDITFEIGGKGDLSTVLVTPFRNLANI
jgi:hypothetical protein